LNRTVLKTSGSDIQPNCAIADFYKLMDGVTNEYAKVVHANYQSGIYAFPFDDVCSTDSPLIQVTNPTELDINLAAWTSTNNKIKISACDNELYLIAFNWNESYEICHIKSGYGFGVDVAIEIESGDYTERQKTLSGLKENLTNNSTVSIPPGTYTLIAVGIDWGGPQNFSFSVNGNTQTLPLNDDPTPDTGVVWHPEGITLTIPKA